VLTFLAHRFVAGETAESAIACGRRLRADGIKATFDLLGEAVLDAEAARRSALANQELLRRLPPEVDRNISIKLTNLGLQISEELCLELTAGVVDAARAVGGFVRIDMEGSAHTQKTLNVFRRLRATRENVGIVLQAGLQRTLEDVREAVASGDRVRLCKGAYREPPNIAWTGPRRIRESFSECARLLLTRGNRPAIATHDEALIVDALRFTGAHRIGPERFEFQMLLGVRRARWSELVRSGHSLRVYVPYGTHWLPYFYRRVRERRENALFALRSVLGG
jgi:proline dehydrogenase